MKIKTKLLWVLPLLFTMASCSSSDPITGQTCPQGPAGSNGEDGKDGQNGKDGQDGLTPRIGANGNWWIGNVDTGVSATGKDGHTPTIELDDDGTWVIDGVDTGIQAVGKDGETPTITIGTDGNWYIDGQNTGVKAEGEDGTSPTITIGENGHWYIDGIDTGYSATLSQIRHIVTLNPNGGTLPADAIASYEVLDGSIIPNLPEPTRNDYEFLGWYTGNGASDGLFTDTTPVYSDLELIARWQSLTGETYTVTWVNYDGTVLEVDEDVNRNTIPTYNGATPTRPNSVSTSFDFSGWSPTVVPATEDITYVAQYREVAMQYQVTFDVGEYGSLSQTEYTVTYGKSIDSPMPSLDNVPGNVVFTGWYTNQELTTKVSFPFSPTEDVTLYAGWEEVTDITDRLTFYYDASRYGYVVRSYNEDPNAPVRSVEIPSTYSDGTHGTWSVVGLEATFSANKNVETVKLPSSIEFIGDNCFANSAIKNVVLPEGLETIGTHAFYDTKITNVDFPSTLTEIGSYAFYDTELGEADLSRTKLTEISERCFYGAPIKMAAFNDGLQSIGGWAFCSCGSLESVTFNDGLQSIGGSAFRDCSSLESVTFNDGLQSIGDCAFCSCGSLESVTFNDGLQSIGGSAFQDCSSLESVTFNDEHRRLGLPVLQIPCFCRHTRKRDKHGRWCFW